MTILRTSAAPAKSRKPATRKPHPLTARWVTRPVYDVDLPGCWSAQVELSGDVYDVCHSETIDDDTGHRWSIFDLHKHGADKTTRLCIDPAGEKTCDCEWSSFKPAQDGHKLCRHLRAMPVLMRRLEEANYAEWAALESLRTASLLATTRIDVDADDATVAEAVAYADRAGPIPF